jgi:hypothetical protein
MKHKKLSFIEQGIFLLLCVFSLSVGFLFKDLFAGLGSNYFNIMQMPINRVFLETEFLSFLIKILPLFFIFLRLKCVMIY